MFGLYDDEAIRFSDFEQTFKTLFWIIFDPGRYSKKLCRYMMRIGSIILSMQYVSTYCTVRSFSPIYNTGKEEYADFDTDEDTNSTKNRPHLFGVGAPINGNISENSHVNLQRNTSNNVSILTKSYTVLTENHTGRLYTHGESLSHNVGIYVWGAYQVRT